MKIKNCFLLFSSWLTLFFGFLADIIFSCVFTQSEHTLNLFLPVVEVAHCMNNVIILVVDER